MKVKKNDILVKIEKKTIKNVTLEFIHSMDTKQAKTFILNGESSGDSKIDDLLNDSCQKEYYLIEKKIELLRKDKEFNEFYKIFYDREIENIKQDVINMLGRK